LDGFKIFKDYIKTSILQDSEFQKLVYYPFSDCLNRRDIDNPFELFDEDSAMNNGNGVHGVVLFKRQADIIMNAEMPVILISFETTKRSKWISNVYIMIRIICKGTNIQELNNGDSRIYSIKEKFNSYIEMANVNGIGEIKELSFKELSINNENDAVLLMYKGFMPSTNLKENVSYNQRKYGVDKLP
jgi:hypothetical protein